MDRASDDATALVIFGGTGDLAEKKLLPALFHLHKNKYLPEQFRILGVSHDDHTIDSYRKFVADSISERMHSHTPEELAAFVAIVDYVEGSFENDALYSSLAEHLETLDDSKFDTCANKLFYLAVPPNRYELIFERLAASGLTIPCGGEEGWTRVLVEKPFGRDLMTAQTLDKQLGKLFQEEQIFRIDHYLAKETVQNIITFRFANALFEPVWNAKNIEHVHILVSEDGGVGERGSFYEDLGALRDVGQNHLLQMLALVAMEDPGKLDPGLLRSARATVLEDLKPTTKHDIKQHVVRGQYDGYRDIDDVADASGIETFFRITAFIDNKRWGGVPFILESGKKLSERKAEITITFKEPISCVCPLEDDHEHRNVLRIQVQPDESISLLFWAKKPGLTYELEPRELSFSYQDSEADTALPDAYEKVLYDCIRGDHTLFASTEEVAASWRFITPILDHWGKTKLLPYRPGTVAADIK
ncbi:glucose-6-phosphate dehydrogenase [bacterium]|nr:glucose-6-phosphate dehydrogenase [bacterium]|tara:strand:+ start:496 stop:1917 length:1422 start_codon:yes stop_codon:yes gene_type:complete